MKKLLTILVAVAATLTVTTSLTSCKDDKKNGKLDPSAKVYINAAKTPQGAPTRIEGKSLTPLEIIKKAQVITFDKGSIGVGEWNRDTVNTRFIVGSDWVIAERGELTFEFIGARDYAFVTLDENANYKDTIAYIPNGVMQAAETAIKKAYAEENYTECYRLLQEAFIFTPSTDVE